MTKIDIFSGFLGAGKTTLIKKLIAEAYTGEKLVLIENEFGEIGVDSGFLQESGIQITEMNSGCICCSLVGDFSRALTEVLERFEPDHILIEPSGVGKLSDIVKAVSTVPGNIQISGLAAVADANRCKMYMRNFGEFFNDQIETASAIILSRTQQIAPEKLEECIALLREHNPKAVIVTTPWDQLTGRQLLEAIEGRNTLTEEMVRLHREQADAHSRRPHDEPHAGIHGPEHEHPHGPEHEHPHGPEHKHPHGPEHEHPHGPEHEHPHGPEHEHPHGPEHEHPHGPEHEHHHHADEIFSSWGVETAKKFSAQQLADALAELDRQEKYGLVLRAKGIVDGDSGWLYFDHVPGEVDVRPGSPAVTGRLCVIGAHLDQQALARLFGV